MASPLRTAFLGLPALTLIRSCQPIRPILQQLRNKQTLASSTLNKTLDGGTYKTATDLSKNRPSAKTPLHAQPPSQPSTQPKPLDWNTFFTLRLRRRRIQVFFSALSGIAGFGVGVAVLGSGLAEPLVSQIPLDPFITLGGLTMVFVAVGWLVGPSLGGQVFYMLNRSIKPQIKQKEAEFFARVKKYRVDPSNSSAANPVPDFYGEKIQSVKGYRQWLKDQRAFNKKKSANFV